MPEASSILNGEAVSLKKVIVGTWDGDGDYSNLSTLYGSVNLEASVTTTSSQRYGDGGKLLATYSRITGGTLTLEFAGDMTSLNIMLGNELETTGTTPNAVRAMRFRNEGLPYFGISASADLEDGTPNGVHFFAPKCQVNADTIQVFNVSGGETAEFTTVSVEVIVLPDDNYADGAVNEVQNIDFATPTTGTYTLSLGTFTTTALAFGANAAAVQAALVALPNIGTGNVTVASGTDFVVTFIGDLAATRLPLLVGAGAGGFDGSFTITRVTRGDEGFDLFMAIYEVEAGYTVSLPPYFTV